MRDILFRGKRADNGAWETGGLVVVRGGCSDEQVYISDKMTGYHTPVLAETVGQYTGLTDKNGKRIFEGDILKGYLDDEFPKNYTIASVVWFGFGWFTKERNCCPDPLEKIDGEIYEVIGNIYDDKEILDVK